MGISIVFVDSRVAGIDTLLAGLPAGAEVRIIDGAADGLDQIAARLQGHSGIDAIHIISHGSAGSVYLGSRVIDNAALATHASQLDAIGKSLSESGDILLYGCNVGAGETGMQFIGSLAQATGADVAASTDLTGAAGFGGNWVLEHNVGPVEATAIEIANYTDTLPAPPGLDYQTQQVSNVSKYIEIGALFSILSYGEGNLASGSFQNSHTPAEYNGYKSDPSNRTVIIDEGFNDNYRAFLNENDQLGRSWTLLSDQTSSSGWLYAWTTALSAWNSGDHKAAFTNFGLYNAYISTPYANDQVITKSYYQGKINDSWGWSNAPVDFPTSNDWLGQSNALVAESVEPNGDKTLVLAFRGTDLFDSAILSSQTWSGTGEYLHYEAFRPLINAANTFTTKPFVR